MKSIDKCKDMMLGIAVGDAFGAGYEGMTPEQIGRCYYALNFTGNPGRGDLKSQSRHEPGRYTDDTQQSLGIAELLSSPKPFVREEVTNALIHAYKRDPRWGYSSTTRKALEKAIDGQNLLNISEFSEGNGAAMRSVPLGALETPQDVVRWARVNADATHHSNEAFLSSAIVGLASFYFFHEIGEPSKVGEFCFDVVDSGSKECKGTFPEMKGDSLPFEYVKSVFSEGGVPPNGLVTARTVISLLEWKGHDPAWLRSDAVLLGGDTDTVCSIALGIAASRYGVENPVPDPKYPKLVDMLENGPYGRSFIVETAKRLATLQPIPVERIRREQYSGRRQEMIVQGLDGLIDDLDPVYLETLMKNLMTKVPYRGDEVILALDSSGYIPGVCASLVTKLPFRATKKASLSGKEITSVVVFQEEGTPNPNIYVYNLPRGSRVILVDDEIMTGRTIENAATELRKNNIEVVAAVVPIEGTAYGPRKMLEEKGIKLFSHTKHPLG